MNKYAKCIVYTTFVKSLIAGMYLNGEREIENNDKEVQSGLEAAVKEASEKGIKLGFKPENMTPEIFWMCGYSSEILNPLDKNKKMVRLGYRNEKHALECLRYGGPEPADVEKFKELAAALIKDLKYKKK